MALVVGLVGVGITVGVALGTDSRSTEASSEGEAASPQSAIAESESTESLVDGEDKADQTGTQKSDAVATAAEPKAPSRVSQGVRLGQGFGIDFDSDALDWSMSPDPGPGHELYAVRELTLNEFYGFTFPTMGSDEYSRLDSQPLEYDSCLDPSITRFDGGRLAGA